VIYNLGPKNNDNETVICCKIGPYKNKLFIHFREYKDYKKSKLYPEGAFDKGMSFNMVAWNKFMEHVTEIN
jgi:uncharacterized protein (DUF1919 family)